MEFCNQNRPAWTRDLIEPRIEGQGKVGSVMNLQMDLESRLRLDVQQNQTTTTAAQVHMVLFKIVCISAVGLNIYLRNIFRIVCY